MRKVLFWVKKIGRFIFRNPHKRLTILIYFYTAVYRYRMLYWKSKRLEKSIGVRNKESSDCESEDVLKRAYYIGRLVEATARGTPWESKCLVCALTARKLLLAEGIATTLYLGVGKENDKMIAHAWLRCGQLYITGGNGSGYAAVTHFLCKPSV